MLKQIPNLSELITALGRLPTNQTIRERIAVEVVPRLLDRFPSELVERPLRGKCVKVLCNPHLYVHRAPYFFGVLFEMHLQRYIERTVRSGDTVIDVGSNAGHVTMLAAEAVGPTGRVIGFEPNPELAERLTQHVSSQDLPNTQIVSVALGPADGEAELAIPGAHTGGGTLGSTDRFSDNETENVSVLVRRGDDLLLAEDLPGRVFLKIDVEGFEPGVLEGLPRFLAAKVDHAVIEVTPEWIGGVAGVERIFQMMSEAGMTPWALKSNGQLGDRLEPKMILQQTDVLFTRGQLSASADAGLC